MFIQEGAVVNQPKVPISIKVLFISNVKMPAKTKNAGKRTSSKLRMEMITGMLFMLNSLKWW